MRNLQPKAPTATRCRLTASGRHRSPSDGERFFPRALPVFSLLLVLPAIAAILFPELSRTMLMTREAVGEGQWWRLMSGHWVHLDMSHFVWDTAAFVALAALLEKRHGKGVLSLTALSAMAVSADVWFTRPDLDYYGGLSGIDSALFAALAGSILLDRDCGKMLRAGAGLTIGLFGLKIGYELISASLVFVNPEAGWLPVPEAHIAGAVAGFTWLILNSSRLLLTLVARGRMMFASSGGEVSPESKTS